MKTVGGTRGTPSAGRRVSDVERLRTLAYELTVAEARERQRLASELHDGLGQLLAVAQFRLGEIEQSLPGASTHPSLVELRSLLVDASCATRSASFDLHSPLLQQLGLRQAIEGLADRLARHGGPRARVDGQLGPWPLTDTAQAVLLRVVRELLLNVYKHARACQVGIVFDDGPRGLCIHVSDDGRGFDAAGRRSEVGPDGGFGLASVEAQMRSIGGRLELSSAPGRGTTASVVLLRARRRAVRCAGTAVSAACAPTGVLA